MNREKALEKIIDEMNLQDERWGKSDHDSFIWCAILQEEVGEFSEACLHSYFGGQKAGNQLDEAIQIAAVATQIIMQFDTGETK